MANVTLRLVKGSPLTNSEVDNNFSNLNIFKTEIGGDLGGNVFYPSVIGLQGRSVSNVAPANSQVLSWSASSNAWIAANSVTTVSYSDLITKPAVNVSITGDLTGTSNVVLSNTNTNNLSINVSYGFGNLDSRFLKLDNPTTQYVTSYVNFQGNVTFEGNVTTIGANNLIISDNFIYINNGSTNTNVDIGLAGNYNDGTYAHAGIFRDASDNGTWKIFDGYLPEPDAAVNIDTDNVSFRLANLAINSLKANSITGISSTSLVTNLNADLLDNQHGTYYLNYANQNNKPSANIVVSGVLTGAANALLGANTNTITIVTASNSSANVSFFNVNASNAVIATSLYAGSVYSNSSPVWTAANDGAGSGLDADLLDGQDSVYYTNYVNQTNKPFANIVLTGNITGSGNAVLNANTNIISVSASVGANSVTLGTHTVGRFIGNVEAGTAIVVSGGGGEDSVAIVSHEDTSTLAGLQGGAGVAGITVDGFGHVTAVTTATYLQQPGLNVSFTGDVTGSGNINLTNSSTNTLTIPLTVAPNSVDLGTDTTGNYVNRVVGGTGITATGTTDEGNVITVGLTTTGVTANTYGNSRIIPVFTVDAQGRITSASNVALSAIGTSTNSQILYNSNGNVVGSSGLIYDGTSIKVNGNLESVFQSGDEGGEIFLKNAITNTSITNGVTIDVYQNKLRFFENGGTTRGFYLDITTGNAGVGTNLANTGGGGGTTDYTALTNKPAANIILTGDVTGSANAVLTAGNTILSITTTIQPNSVALGTDTTGNYTDRVINGGNITVSGTADEGNVITISIPQAVSPSSDLQFRNVTLSGNLSLPALANIINSTTLTIVGNTQATSSTTGELVVQGGLGVGGNVWASGNVIAANNFSTRYISSSNTSYFIEPAGSNAVIVAGNVYTNQRIGFMNVNTTTSVVYQYYNANARSLDTVFG